MEPPAVISVEIMYCSGALLRVEEFRTCRTYISRKGVIRTTFERSINYGEPCGFAEHSTLPTQESYEYRVDKDITSALFRKFDLHKLKTAAGDSPFCDGGSWKVVIHTATGRTSLSGFCPPEPFGKELAIEIIGLLAYKLVPMLF